MFKGLNLTLLHFMLCFLIPVGKLASTLRWSQIWQRTQPDEKRMSDGITIAIQAS